MAAIDYLDIEENLASIFRADENLIGIGVRVDVEESFNPIPDRCPWIGIYLDSWDTPADGEFIGGTSPFQTFLNLEIWLYEFALENKKGCQLRDALLQKVKEVLKTHRTINGTVLVTRFEGGEFDNAKTKEGFFKGVSIKLQAEVRE